jgi:hypothetical protein
MRGDGGSRHPLPCKARERGPRGGRERQAQVVLSDSTKIHDTTIAIVDCETFLMEQLLAILDTLGVALDWIVTKSGLVTSLAAATGAIVAILSYRKWHPENIGKRKIELAEEIIADFYQARDVIAWARFPGGWSSEKSSRAVSVEESEDEKNAKDSYFRTVDRLVQRAELFSKIQSKKYRAMAYFGVQAKEPFEDLGKIYAEVLSAAGKLVRHYTSDGTLPKTWSAWEKTIGWNEEDAGADSPDSVEVRMNAVIQAVESSYGKWLMR